MIWRVILSVYTYFLTHLGLSPPAQEKLAPTPEVVRVPVDDERREILAG